MRNLIFLNCGNAAISLAQSANIAALKAQFLARTACNNNTMLIVRKHLDTFRNY